MPELPEVETVRRSLETRLPGRTIEAVWVLNRHLRTPLHPAGLRARLVGRRVERVGRRAKYLWLHLSGGQVLVLHLGMSGRLSLLEAAADMEPHTHVRLRLDGGLDLRYRDPRRFGMLFVVPEAALPRHPRFLHLGPEPLGAGFTPLYLQRSARGVRRPVKNFLMDASVVVGVGNIYASEALYRARVHPQTPAQRLRQARWRRVHAAVRATLQHALRAGGTTLADFRAADGRAGEFQVQLKVYGRAGAACGRCGRRIRRLELSGRSTFYCPACQR
jgi:formamidopyrimidine-DNA glycosylase